MGVASAALVCEDAVVALVIIWPPADELSETRDQAPLIAVKSDAYRTTLSGAACAGVPERTAITGITTSTGSSRRADKSVIICVRDRSASTTPRVSAFILAFGARGVRIVASVSRDATGRRVTVTRALPLRPGIVCRRVPPAPPLHFYVMKPQEVNVVKG